MSAKRVQRPFLACLWMMGALIALSAMAIAGRELSVELNAFQIALTRSVFCLVVLIPILSVIALRL